jgi:DNA modification methylase
MQTPTELNFPEQDILRLSKKDLFKKLLKSNLDFNAKKKNQISRHYWHSFPAKFPPELPKLFIKHLTTEGQIVLDPMAGSCTTLIEAANLRRQALGFDIDPLSLTIGKAKVNNIDIRLAKIESYRILQNAKKEFDNKECLQNLLENEFDKDTLDFLDYWYEKQTQFELIALLQQIKNVEDESIKIFLKLIFSSIIITKSGGVTRAMDLAHTRPHKVSTKKINSAFLEFEKKASKILNNGYCHLPVTVHLNEGNVKKTGLSRETIDLIITSPPYANNAIDYMRAHKFSLVWFGYKISELKLLRKSYIGSDTISLSTSSKLPEYVGNIIKKLGEKNSKRSRILSLYFDEMRFAIEEMYRVLKPKSGCIIVVATSIINGLDVETHNCLAEIGKYTGFELIHIGERVIHRDSRMLPSSYKKNESQIEARMHNEFVIGFWKS